MYTYSCVHLSCIYKGWFLSNEHTYSFIHTSPIMVSERLLISPDLCQTIVRSVTLTSTFVWSISVRVHHLLGLPRFLPALSFSCPLFSDRHCSISDSVDKILTGFVCSSTIVDSPIVTSVLVAVIVGSPAVISVLVVNSSPAVPSRIPELVTDSHVMPPRQQPCCASPNSSTTAPSHLPDEQQ